MIAFIKNILGIERKEENKGKNDFSEFFLSAKSNEKAKVIKQVLKEASEEQRNVMKKYREEARTI